MHRGKGRPNIPQGIKDEIVEKHRQGKSVHELAQEDGKTHKTIKGLLYREKLKVRRREAGLPSKQRGRKAAVTLAEYKYERKRLHMENELLRDFLHLAGRK